MKNKLFGIGLALVLSLIAKMIGSLPYLQILGPLVIAILLGIAVRHWFPIPEKADAGIQFSAQKLLRLGIILMGLRLNWQDLIQAGPKVIGLAAVCLVFGIGIVYVLSRALGIDRDMAILVSCGTGICGAAAVVAVAPQVEANRAKTGTAVAVVCVMGTIMTLVYAFVLPLFALSSAQYGEIVGATLHEVAHVVAASDSLGTEAVNLAIMVKLSRVAMLAPVALMLGFVSTWRRQRSSDAYTDVQTNTSTSFINKVKALPIPWFVVGFLLAATVRSMGWVSPEAAASIVDFSYILLGMGMAGLGLNMHVSDIKLHGSKAFIACLIGSVLLSGLGMWLVM
ncbi:YeiH family protein [Paenibacillus sp. 1001270B_150601_E10]|uniref:YeiH family protein n=1 Tax=Paenibacillus sp. 1001270B_150601_E10 TaxID=2787079 RepID=UPI00189DCA6F|nr:YeiH family protein [Paenibacillus sp. 1001270B_150601_E10]